MTFLHVSGATLYYDYFSRDITRAYPDTTLLLLHGFAGTAASDFSAQIPHLRDRYNVLAPHLRGYGRSSPRSEYPVSFYRDDVADIITLLDTLQLSHVHVLAFSDGAIVGLLLAALHPQRVTALAALGAQPTIDAQDVSAIRHWLLERPLSAEWQAELAQLHGEPYWRSLPSLYVKAQEDLLAAGGVLISDAELANIQCPTLIMHGARDRIVPVHYAHLLHERTPHSQLLIFDAGHAAHLRCEQEYTQAVLTFFHDHST
jgi:valacyclovir hydrolase